MIQMNFIYKTNRLIDMENKLMVTKGNSSGLGRGEKLGVWD